jgi:hypothetical protein
MSSMTENNHEQQTAENPASAPALNRHIRARRADAEPSSRGPLWFSGRENGTDSDGLVIHAVKAGWYCPLCREQFDIECDGPRLSETLAARSTTARESLHSEQRRRLSL